MLRFFLEIAYKGTNYHGWQIQENAHTVQAEISRVLFALFSNSNIETTGCGRTDTGVHARQFYLHFDAPENIYDPEEFCMKMNRMLPSDIVVYRMIPVHHEAHARFDASARTYEYHISTHKNPFESELSWLMSRNLDVSLMNEAAKLLLKHDDFASFCKVGATSKTTICKVSRADWQNDQDKLIFTISADRFLRNMVRAIVGTLIQVGKGQLDLLQFEAIIQSKNRSDAGESVPAAGLFLTNITYPYIRQE